MPLYKVVTQDGFLSAEQRDVIAAMENGGIMPDVGHEKPS